ncbi:MAG: hypothetical protein II740_03565 [Lachnospiraceae bacterium]|nr:hypothetical protein [Lachnospiraceae bacterium]
MFSLLRADKGNNPAIKEMAVAAATYGIGEVLAESNGLLTKVTGTVKPAYVSCGVGTKTSGDLLAVNPIYKDMEFTTTLAASGALKVGEKVTIHSDSAQVTATTTSGVATLLEITGTASGSKVVVKFE